MKGQGETGRGGSQEREGEARREREGGREGKEGREKNKGVFTCLWNQQLAALSHNLRHMDIIRTTVSVCVSETRGFVRDRVCVCVCVRLKAYVSALRATEDSHVFVVQQNDCCTEQLHQNTPPSHPSTPRGTSQSDSA